MNRLSRITLTRLQWEGVYLLYWTLLLGIYYYLDFKGLSFLGVGASLLGVGVGVVISVGLLLPGFQEGVRIRYAEVRMASGLQSWGEAFLGLGVAGLVISDIFVWGMSLLFLLVGVTFLVLYAHRSAQLDVQTRSNEGNAQVHQLGALQQEYSVRLYKLLALYLYGMLVLLATFLAAPFVDLIVGGIMLVLLPYGGAFFYYRQLHVYVYTDGFLYLDGNHSRAVRWEQISKVSRGSWLLGAYIKVQGESTITLPAYISGLRNLRSTFKREMASRRTSSAMGG